MHQFVLLVDDVRVVAAAVATVDVELRSGVTMGETSTFGWMEQTLGSAILVDILPGQHHYRHPFLA